MNVEAKMWVNSIDFPSLECPKLYLTKIIILSDVVLNAHIETI